MQKPFVPSLNSLFTSLLLPQPSRYSINRQLLPVWLLLGLGFGLRFANLLGKPLWLDEAFTLFHISGFTPEAATTHLVTGLPIKVTELLQYQQPHADHSLWNTVKNIADSAPELPPLYFALLHRWMLLFGGSVWAMRSLGALISLAIFPCIYWLCLELFGLAIVGWYSMALVAVSPFHLNLAQEIRPYSLWTVCFLAASALFLRAQRRQSWRDWVGFSIAVLAGMYTHLFMLLPWLVYWLHSLLHAKPEDSAKQNRRRSHLPGKRGQSYVTRAFKQFVVANGLIIAGFIPWLWWGFLRPRTVQEPIFAKPHDSLASLFKGVVQGISRFFIDFSVNETSHRGLLVIYGICVAAVLTIVLYSLSYLTRQSQRRSWTFIWLMSLVPIGLFIASDLLLNASRTNFTRYYTPSMIAIEIAIAYCMASKHTFRFQSSGLKPRWERRWMALLMIGTISCGLFVITPTWWSKTHTSANACIIQAAARQPYSNGVLIVTDDFYMRSLALAHQLQSNVQFQFHPLESSTAPDLTPETKSTFLYLPSPGFLQAMNQQYNLKPTCQSSLWQVGQRRKLPVQL